MAKRLDVIVTGALGFIGRNLCPRIWNDKSTSSFIMIDKIRDGAGSDKLVDSYLKLLSVGKAVLPDALLDRDDIESHDWRFDRSEGIVVYNLGFLSNTTFPSLAAYPHENDDLFRLLKALVAANSKVMSSGTSVPIYVVNASSAAVYGSSADAPDDDHMPQPNNYYGLAKALQESRLDHFCRMNHGVKYVNMRLFNVFGLNEEDKLSSKTASFVYTIASRFVQWVKDDPKKRLRMEVFCPDTRRDFVGVDTVVQSMMTYAQAMANRQPIARQSFGVGTSESVKLRECIDIMTDVLSDWGFDKAAVDASFYIHDDDIEPPFVIDGSYQRATRARSKTGESDAREAIRNFYVDFFSEKFDAPKKA